MSSLLESIYYGNLRPDEKAVSHNEEYTQISEQISAKMADWKVKLPPEEWLELESMWDLYYQLNSMDRAGSFTYGFRLGGKLMIEVLQGER
ncbi:hypothetical protein QE450_002981 [Paenibacillus sp. SORGH_AS306]|uniref:DUF6809 family protein n=1 Tax=unclassified Paenibacillus TaxID=185978 RepID=UPI00278A46CF|nr:MULTISPECIES: DUF6809 family protein [unclassified Paenibacillus]MDQ1235483.1 hypothetical protein [Paenibacillus sp. SORGH_AS_0306]MDR6112532.1 hypothetical protein [Paenibacillus sp. SORGH_AS_0338]